MAGPAKAELAPHPRGGGESGRDPEEVWQEAPARGEGSYPAARII